MDNGTTPRRRRRPRKTELVKAKPAGLVFQLPPLNKANARRLTDEIREHVSEAWTLLVEAHERQVWKVLGYPTWEAYVRTEFDMSRSRSYQILDHARVTRELVSASGVSTSVDISEAAARELKGHVHEVVTRVHHRLAEGDPDDDPVEVVNEVVTEFREELDQAEFEADMDREYAEHARKEREKRHARRRMTAAGTQPSSTRALGDFIVKVRRLRRDLLDVVEAAPPFMSEHGDEEQLLAEATRLRSAASLLEDIAKGDDLEVEIAAFLESEEGA